MATVVATGGLGKGGEQFPHLAEVQRRQVIGLELVVERGPVVLAFGRRGRRRGYEHRGAGPLQDLAEDVLLLIVQVLENKLNIVDQEHRTALRLARSFQKCVEGLPRQVALRTLAVGKSGLEFPHGNVNLLGGDVLGLGLAARAFQGVSQRVEAIHPELR